MLFRTKESSDSLFFKWKILVNKNKPNGAFLIETSFCTLLGRKNFLGYLDHSFNG
jgi:hypothetical protein